MSSSSSTGSPLVHLVPAWVAAIVMSALVVAASRLRTTGLRRRWGAWIAIVLSGAAAALLVRAGETLVVAAALGRFGGANEVLPSLIAFGIVGPFTVLAIATAIWGPLKLGGLNDPIDPSLAAAACAIAFATARVTAIAIVDHDAFETGLRGGLGVVTATTIAALWGYGLSLSSLDGTLGGTPFGRYAFFAMLLQGTLYFSLNRPHKGGIAVAIGIAVVTSGLATIGLVRLSRSSSKSLTSITSLGREAIRELAREELRRGKIRPSWIVVGAVGHVGGIVLGLLAAAILGGAAHIDFGEIDRGGPGAEYAALLLVLGVVVSFPVCAAIVGLAGGGREHDQHAYLLEAGISSVVALGAALFVVGVVAPVAIALGVACAPVAFGLAGLGAWITTGRRL